jgi:hypothetical protein
LALEAVLLVPKLERFDAALHDFRDFLVYFRHVYGA